MGMRTTHTACVPQVLTCGVTQQQDWHSMQVSY